MERNQSNFRDEEEGEGVYVCDHVIFRRVYSHEGSSREVNSGCGVDSRATCACVPCEIAISSSDIITWSLL